MNRSDAFLARFLALHPKEIDLSLGRIERLLASLGNPHRAMPPVIHVAGTNGKGSTVAFLRAMLEAAGHAVHVYTSPHLVRFHERIRLGVKGGRGRLVSEDELIDAFERVEAANAGAPITFFEITTAAAYLLFHEHPADVVLLETGLGGRFDTTNVIDKPLATAITRISIDHTRFLGETLAEIASAKAGILKRGVPGLIGPQEDAARAVFEDEARRVGAPLAFFNQDFQAREERGRLVFEDGDGLLDLPPPRLLGRHQYENAGLAIATLRAIRSDISVNVSAIETGLTSVEWPARMQRLSQGRLHQLLSPESELWLDGGHNPDGGRVVANAFGELEERVTRPLVLVVGMINTKDSEGFLDAFAGMAAHVHAVPIEGNPNSRTAEEVAQAALHAGIPATTHPDLASALKAIAGQPGPAPRVLITGSLYLAGVVLAENDTPPS